MQMSRTYEDLLAWQKAHHCQLAKDLGYIDDNKFTNIVNSIQDASYFLNSYIKGIVGNNGIKD